MNGCISNLSQILKCRRVVCADGSESGLKIVEIGNGVIGMDLLESNALDIGGLTFKGGNVSFLSKNGFGASGGFLRAFPGGMLYTCGLESLGDRSGFPMHGSLHSLPCKIVKAEADGDTVEVVGCVGFTELFGANLRLTRKITLKNNEVTVCDKLKNLGFNNEKYCLLYHINFGYPFLDGCAYLEFDAKSTKARTEFAEKNIGAVKTMGAPQTDIREAVYFHRLAEPRVRVISPNAGVRAEITYSAETLPCLIEWKSLKCGDYALGIEPSTSFLDGGFGYSTVGAGKSVENTVKLRFEEI